MFIYRQVNLHKSGTPSAELIDLVKNDVFLVAVQEPALYQGKVCSLDNRHKINYGDKNPRAAFYSHNSLNIWLQPSLSDRDTVTILWKNPFENEDKIIFINCYWDILKDDIPDKVIDALEYGETNNLPVCISMDSNSHSHMWGCTNTDARGRKVEDLIFDKHLSLLNTGNKPTFIGGRGQSNN